MINKEASADISHEYVEERLSAYLDGRLPEAERAQVRKHLQGCARCQTSLDSLGWTVNLLKQVPAPPLPRQFTLPLPEPKRAPAPWFRWGLATASAMAAVALIFIVSVQFLSNRAGSTELAIPAAAPPPYTLVAVAAPTVAPSVADRAPQPTAAPLPAVPSSLPPTITPSQVPTLRVAAAQPTTESAATGIPSQAELATPTEETRPLVLKSAPSSPPCLGCGGGIGGGPPNETPVENRMTAESVVTVTGTVKDGPLTVRAYPSERSARIGLLARGDNVQVFDRDETGEWLQIVFPFSNDQGQTGWVSSQYVILPVPENSIPTSTPSTETPTPSP